MVRMNRVISPLPSASKIILFAIRSLTEFAGLLDSSFATISAPPDGTTLFIRTIGVFPITSNTESAILGRADTFDPAVAENNLVIGTLYVFAGLNALANAATHDISSTLILSYLTWYYY